KRTDASRSVTLRTTWPSFLSWNWGGSLSDMSVSSRRGRALLGCQGLTPALMVLGQLDVGVRDRLGLGRDAGDVLARNDDVEFILAEVCVDSITDAAGGRDDAAGERGRKCHAGRPAEERCRRGDAGPQRGLLQEHQPTGATGHEHDVWIDR